MSIQLKVFSPFVESRMSNKKLNILFNTSYNRTRGCMYIYHMAYNPLPFYIFLMYSYAVSYSLRNINWICVLCYVYWFQWNMILKTFYTFSWFPSRYILHKFIFTTSPHRRSPNSARTPNLIHVLLTIGCMLCRMRLFLSLCFTKIYYFQFVG